jgi:NO-binding membrane sensor protein with MHYT domain
MTSSGSGGSGDSSSNGIGEELIQEWKIANIIASIGLSFLGTYTTTTLSEQYRVSHKMKMKRKQQFYLMAMAVSTGAVAIWSMHFVGMGALFLEQKSPGGDGDGNGGKKEIKMVQYFDITLTILSLLCSVVSVYLGLTVASHDPFYRKEPAEIFSHIVQRGIRSLSVTDMQNPTVLWILTLFSDLHLIALGGLITGLGVCLMHYVGMMSMTMNMAITWDASIVTASVIIACVASIVANWILFRLLALYPKRESLRIACAVILCVAVCGMHYTGMAAATYHPLPVRAANSYHWDLPLVPRGYMGSTDAIFIALVFGLSLSWIFIMIALADLRAWHYSLKQGLNESRKLAQSRGSQFDEDRLLRQSIDLGAQYDRMNEAKPRRPRGASEGDAGDCESGLGLDIKRRSRVHPLPIFSAAAVKSPPSPLYEESPHSSPFKRAAPAPSAVPQSACDRTKETFPQEPLNQKETPSPKFGKDCGETIVNSSTHEISVQSKGIWSQRSRAPHGEHSQLGVEDDEEEDKASDGGG